MGTADYLSLLPSSLKLLKSPSRSSVASKVVKQEAIRFGMKLSVSVPECLASLMKTASTPAIFIAQLCCYLIG